MSDESFKDQISKHGTSSDPQKERTTGRQITKDEIVKDLTILRAVVGEKTQLDSRGFGLCPFHAEKTPSFNIFIAASGRARFHCFGCGADGDVFNFLNRSENLSFTSSLKRIETILNQPVSAVFPFSEDLSSEDQRSEDPSTTPKSRFCERDCQKYINLREDYNILLEENLDLRQKHGLGEFKPTNEKSASIHLNLRSKTIALIAQIEHNPSIDKDMALYNRAFVDALRMVLEWTSGGA